MKGEKNNPFACRCGCGRDWADPRLKRLIKSLAGLIGQPLVVTSGYR